MFFLDVLKGGLHPFLILQTCRLVPEEGFQKMQQKLLFIQAVQRYIICLRMHTCGLSSSLPSPLPACRQAAASAAAVCVDLIHSSLSCLHSMIMEF